MKYLILAFLLVGCGTEEYQTITSPEHEYIDDNWTKYEPYQHRDLCEEIPESIFCVNSPSVGDMQPTREYALSVAIEMATNTIYEPTTPWYYNYTVYEELKGDCEDVAMTIIQHMVDDGIDKKYLALAYQLTPNDRAHIFAIVDTINFGKIHIDYPNSGYPIERVNYIMKMTDAGYDKWIKGN